ncbi:ABC transporter substrate-binding protein [Streptomyces antimycoticus]|uniref:ABC transporter substrate-binding protein n=1 Tax=Streptomyces antimycoticus TaxID=68175 RepID=UPI0036CB75DF
MRRPCRASSRSRRSTAVPAVWPTPGRRSSWPRPPETRSDIAAAPAPIRIGYCLSLTGSLADNGRSARLAHEIWRQDVNSRGGLLGRPVEFVRYDDEGNADNVPRIYERLIDEHDVDLVTRANSAATLNALTGAATPRRLC